jgi:hypothetical protein
MVMHGTGLAAAEGGWRESGRTHGFALMAKATVAASGLTELD